MTQVQTPETLFADARAMHEAALERLAAGDIRDAAEKAWCATVGASNALILARTGNMPERSPGTSRELRVIAQNDREVRELVPRYFTKQAVLHGECFYMGMCEPLEDAAQRIQETIKYIEDAERLAGV